MAPVALVLLAATLGAAALMPAALREMSKAEGRMSNEAASTFDIRHSTLLAKDSAFLKRAPPSGFVASGRPAPGFEDVYCRAGTRHANAINIAGCRVGREVAKIPVPIVEGWAEQMFTAGLVKDFGAVPQGTRLFHRFPVTNVHAVPVEITGLRASCGCIQATRAKRILQPGESTTIDVSLDTREFAGPDTESVRVAVGPNPVSTCELTVSAASRSNVICVPDRIAFGTLAPGQTSVRSTDIEYRGAGDPLAGGWKIEEVTVPKNLPVEATLRETARGPAMVSYRLTVTLRPGARTGRIRDYAYLRTNRKRDPPLPVMVTANVLPVQHSLPRATADMKGQTLPPAPPAR